MASVVVGPRECLREIRNRFGWVDPVLLAWAVSVGFAFLTAETLDYDMLKDSLRVLFYATLFELVVEIPNKRADTPNSEQLTIIVIGISIIIVGLIVESFAYAVSGELTPAQLVGLSALNSRVYANYTIHDDMSLVESLRGRDHVTHPYMTVSAIAAFVSPLLLKLWIHLFGVGHVPKLQSTDTYFWLVVLAATTGLVVYYHRRGHQVGAAADESDAENVDS